MHPAAKASIPVMNPDGPSKGSSFQSPDRDFTQWSQRDEAAAALTPDQVNAALKKYLKPRKAGLVQVENFK